MVSVKKQNTAKSKVNRKLLIVLGLFGAILLLIVGFWFRSVLIQRQTLAELSGLNKELRIVYNSILSDNKDKILDTYFRNDCSVSHPSWIDERVSCGPSGRITVKRPLELNNITDSLKNGVGGSIFNLTLQTSIEKVDDISVNGILQAPAISAKCYVGYGKNQLTGKWEYWLTCRKDAPGILPGYAVEE